MAVEPAEEAPPLLAAKTWQCRCSTKTSGCSWWISRQACLCTLRGHSLRRERLCTPYWDMVGWGRGVPPRSGPSSDKDTTGVLVVAKSVEAYKHLIAMMRRREVDRRYLALVHGRFASESGTIEAPVGRDPVRGGSRWRLGGGCPGSAHTSGSWRPLATSPW